MAKDISGHSVLPRLNGEQKPIKQGWQHCERSQETRLSSGFCSDCGQNTSLTLCTSISSFINFTLYFEGEMM